MFLKDYEGFKHKSIYKRRAKVEVGFKVKLERNQWEMAVRDGRGGDEDGAAIFEEEGVDLTDEEDIALSDIPLHLRPLVSAAESGDLDALRRALGNYYCFIRKTNGILWWFFFLSLPYFPQENTIVRCICWFLEKNRYQYRRAITLFCVKYWLKFCFSSLFVDYVIFHSVALCWEASICLWFGIMFISLSLTMITCTNPFVFSFVFFCAPQRYILYKFSSLSCKMSWNDWGSAFKEIFLGIALTHQWKPYHCYEWALSSYERDAYKLRYPLCYAYIIHLLFEFEMFDTCSSVSIFIWLSAIAAFCFWNINSTIAY